jgi:hypothetical protein
LAAAVFSGAAIESLIPAGPAWGVLLCAVLGAVLAVLAGAALLVVGVEGLAKGAAVPPATGVMLPSAFKTNLSVNPD